MLKHWFSIYWFRIQTVYLFLSQCVYKCKHVFTGIDSELQFMNKSNWMSFYLDEVLEFIVFQIYVWRNGTSDKSGFIVKGLQWTGVSKWKGDSFKIKNF